MRTRIEGTCSTGIGLGSSRGRGADKVALAEGVGEGIGVLGRAAVGHSEKPGEFGKTHFRFKKACQVLLCGSGTKEPLMGQERRMKQAMCLPVPFPGEWSSVESQRTSPRLRTSEPIAAKSISTHLSTG